MPKIETRQLTGDELLEVVYSLCSYAFHPSPPLTDKKEWTDWVSKAQGITCYATFEDGAAMANALDHAMTQNVRGKLYPMGGVWGVATHPLGRRKGYCRQAMAALLEHERKAGMPFSCLYPFKESFYERMGYVGFPKVQRIKVTPRQLLPLLKSPLAGRLELLRIAQGYDAYFGFLAKMQPHIHGMALFDFTDREGIIKDDDLWVVTASLDGKVEGVLLYANKPLHADKPGPGPMKMTVPRLYFNNRQAFSLLLSWIARHADQIETAEIDLPPGEQPSTWLSDLELGVEYVFPPGMGRVIDVASIGGMQVGEGSFTAGISDPLCPWNEGVWQFSAEKGKLVVKKGEKAQCKLTIQGLNALVYGICDPHDLPGRGWGEPDEGTVEAMRSLFPKTLPYMHSKF